MSLYDKVYMYWATPKNIWDSTDEKVTQHRFWFEKRHCLQKKLVSDFCIQDAAEAISITVRLFNF